MEVQPGVVVREYLDKKQQRGDNDNIKVTGGDFRVFSKLGEKASRMSSKQYSELSGIR